MEESQLPASPHLIAGPREALRNLYSHRFPHHRVWLFCHIRTRIPDCKL